MWTINKRTFETLLLDENVTEKLLSMTKEEVDNVFGVEFSRMVGYDQKTCWHCYTLWEHTVRVVAGISKNKTNPKYYVCLKIAAFFHDAGKPDVVFTNKYGQNSYKKHAIESAKIARKILSSIGYKGKMLERIIFYVTHHDDFLCYKKEEYIPKSNTEYIVINKENLRIKMQKIKNSAPYDATLYDIYGLLNISKADSKAQNKVTFREGKKIGSTEENLENYNYISTFIDDIYPKVYA